MLNKMVASDLVGVCYFALLAVTVVFGQDTLCNDNLLRSLPDDHLSASSFRSAPVYAGPDRVRLNTTQSSMSNGTVMVGAWAPTQENKQQYIQAMFDDLTMINKVYTQGENQGTDHVTAFKIQYTLDGQNWVTKNNDIGVEEIFMGNSDGDTVIENELSCPLFAKGIRIIPMDWDKRIAMRVELNGCYLDNSGVANPVGVANSTTKFLPGVMTPAATTSNPNLMTLIQWFYTGLSKSTQTTTPYVFHPGIQNPFGTTRGSVAG